MSERSPASTFRTGASTKPSAGFVEWLDDNALISQHPWRYRRLN